MGVAYFLLLCCLLAITAQAQDCSRPVPGDHMSLSDSDILLQTFPDGQKVSFTCDPGYISAGGSSTITCTAGTWSPVKLRCEKKSCGSAGEVTNGHVDYPEGTEFGDKAVIRCDTGYMLVGKSEIYCGVQGWRDRLPVCEVVKCNPPPEIVNGAFSPVSEEYSYRDVVQYRCEYQYILNGSKTIICSEEGTFKPDPPTCVKEVSCENPDVDHGVWIEGSRPPYKFSATVTFECQSGYTMKGARTQTCDRNGKWSPGLPTCELDKGYNTQNIANRIIFFALGFFVGGAVTGFLLWAFLKKRKGSLRTCPDKNGIEENGKDSKEGSELVALSNCNSPVGPT